MKLKLKNRWWFGGMLLLGMSAGGIAFAQTDAKQTQRLPLDELQLFADVFGRIKLEYVDKVDDATLLRDAIDGMLSGLDPHSSFLDPNAFKDMRISAEGKFGGLGVEIVTEDGMIKVIAPIDDTPAYRAGIQSGDIITMLDGVSVQGMGLQNAIDSMRGPPGSKMVLTISRAGESETFDVPLVRAVINVVSVKSEMLEEGFAYVRITNFQNGTGASLRATMKKLQQQQQLKGLVLDLRNNPGGVLHGAVEITDAFLSSGVIVSIRGRNSDADHSFNATADDVSADAPIVVLVNGGSASASEIVAGALQDHKRAIIMGTTTFGKGSVQSLIPMNNGGALKLTTARYYTPAERSIQVRGVVPDVIVEQVQPGELAQGAWRVRESDLHGHLENNVSNADGDNNNQQKRGSGLAARDYQVSEALNLLKGMNLVKLRGQNTKTGSGEG